ncbi:MAG: hypothetical protein ACRDZY_08125 [Acidimicrobiales bacterium]
MKPGRRLISTLLVVLFAAPTAPALAIRTPPGNSAGNQYVETLPGASGNHPLTPGKGLGLSAQVRRVLAAQGKAGLVVLGLGAQAPTQASGGPSAAGNRHHRGTRTSVPAPRPVSVQSPVVAVGGVLTGSGTAGLGWGLPVILVLMTAAALVLAFRGGSWVRPRP